MWRKYVTQKLVTRINALTTNLFEHSVTEVADIKDITPEQLQDFIQEIRSAHFGYMMPGYSNAEIEELKAQKEKIDELYLQKMISLSSKDLTDILFLHERGKPKRAQRTLEAITSELARRSLLDDSSQSDAIYNNGDVDVRSKSEPTSKKAEGKKYKTTENR